MSSRLFPDQIWSEKNCGGKGKMPCSDCIEVNVESAAQSQSTLIINIGFS